jgi:hypothetical protein
MSKWLFMVKAVPIRTIALFRDQPDQTSLFFSLDQYAAVSIITPHTLRTLHQGRLFHFALTPPIKTQKPSGTTLL